VIGRRRLRHEDPRRAQPWFEAWIDGITLRR
jgi:hypothetical protein